MTPQNTPMILFIRYEAAMQALIELAKLNRETGMYTDLPDSIFLKEFCTVGTHAPSQTGSTTWGLVQLGLNENAIMVVSNHKQKKLLESQPGIGTSIGCRIYTYRDIESAINRYARQADDTIKSTFDEIILDESESFFKVVRINKFYDWLAKRNDVQTQWIYRLN